MKYTYPNTLEGYHWNTLQRIKNDIGIEPISLTLINEQLILTFSRDLTVSEKAKVDTIMQNNPGYPPSTASTTFIIKDLWEEFEQFKTDTGINLKLYYDKSSTNKFDRIILQADRVLTKAEINKVKSIYANLIQG